MDQIQDIWAAHLRAGERLMWSASASDALLAAARNRTRLIGALTGLAAGLLALLLAGRFLESLPGYATADIAASLLTPLYGVFALAMAALAVVGLRRLSPQPPRAIHFAATNFRLIALTRAGALADELPAEEIDGLIAGGRPAKPDIFVLRKADPDERRAFSIEHIERPLEAKAVIEAHFLESAPATAQP
jgi:hypothetical protein